MLTKSFSPSVSRMVLIVCLAMVSLSPFMLPLTSTTITRSLGEVAAWMYLERMFFSVSLSRCYSPDRQAARQVRGQDLSFYLFPSLPFLCLCWLFKLISINWMSSTPAAIGVFPDSPFKILFCFSPSHLNFFFAGLVQKSFNSLIISTCRVKIARICLAHLRMSASLYSFFWASFLFYWSMHLITVKIRQLCNVLV